MFLSLLLVGVTSKNNGVNFFFCLSFCRLYLNFWRFNRFFGQNLSGGPDLRGAIFGDVVVLWALLMGLIRVLSSKLVATRKIPVRKPKKARRFFGGEADEARKCEGGQ